MNSEFSKEVKAMLMNLVINHGYSVMRFKKELNDGYEYGACNKPLDFDYTHDGKWGVGNTPLEALWDCHLTTLIPNT